MNSKTIKGYSENTETCRKIGSSQRLTLSTSWMECNRDAVDNTRLQKGHKKYSFVCHYISTNWTNWNSIFEHEIRHRASDISLTFNIKRLHKYDKSLEYSWHTKQYAVKQWSYFQVNYYFHTNVMNLWISQWAWMVQAIHNTHLMTGILLSCETFYH